MNSASSRSGASRQQFQTRPRGPFITGTLDALEERRTGRVSAFNGPKPPVRYFETFPAEVDGVGKWLRQAHKIDHSLPAVFLQLHVSLRFAPTVERIILRCWTALRALCTLGRRFRSGREAELLQGACLPHDEVPREGGIHEYI